uniref:histidine kinase n=1 Tax=Phaeomonas parva TaxID=124430 RepID=A0A7S1UCH0_9STRA|mmetsp:Transcript_38580/g.120785  ORF Transcript_38580/g.120785 Transcript_38580/m.120785 type:complete len:965 (+) Transcript_38580:268-3162(+)
MKRGRQHLHHKVAPAVGVDNDENDRIAHFPGGGSASAAPGASCASSDGSLSESTIMSSVQADALAATERMQRIAKGEGNRKHLAHLPIAFGKKNGMPHAQDRDGLPLLKSFVGIDHSDPWLYGREYMLQFKPDLEDAFQTTVHVMDDESQLIVVAIAISSSLIFPRACHSWMVGSPQFGTSDVADTGDAMLLAVVIAVNMKSIIDFVHCRRLRKASSLAEARSIRQAIAFGRMPLLLSFLATQIFAVTAYLTQCGDAKIGYPLGGGCITLETMLLPEQLHFVMLAAWVVYNLAVKSRFDFTCITSVMLATCQVWVYLAVDMSVHNLNQDEVQRYLACLYLSCPLAFLLGTFYHFELLRRRQFLLALANNDHVLKAMDAKGRIQQSAKFLCHELRNPLQSILGGLRSFTALDVSPSTVSDLVLSKEDKAMLETVWIGMVCSAQQLTSITTDVLDFERISAGRLPFQFEKTRLSDTLEDVVKMFRTVYEGVRFNIDVEQDVVTWTDPRRVRQILMNGVSNAIKYTVPKYADKSVPGCPEVTLKMRINQFGAMPFRRDSNLSGGGRGSKMDSNAKANPRKLNFGSFGTRGRYGSDDKSGKNEKNGKGRKDRGVGAAKKVRPLVLEMTVTDNGPGLTLKPGPPHRGMAQRGRRGLGMHLSSAIAEALQGFIDVNELTEWDRDARDFRAVGARFIFCMPVDPNHTTVLAQRINRTTPSVALSRRAAGTRSNRPSFDKESGPNASPTSQPRRGDNDEVPSSRRSSMGRDSPSDHLRPARLHQAVEEKTSAEAASAESVEEKASNEGREDSTRSRGVPRVPGAPPQKKYKYKTMVIEDDETVRTLAQYSLRQCDAAVRCVDDRNLHERVSEITKTTINGVAFDVVFVDIFLGSLDGRDVCRQLREQGYAKAVVAATANTSTEDVASYKAAGFDGVLAKPYMQEDLLKVLQFYEEIGFERSPFVYFERFERD